MKEIKGKEVASGRCWSASSSVHMEYLPHADTSSARFS